VPELPEVETVRRALERTLIGRVVRTCEAKAVRLRAGLDPACLTARLPGACIERVVRRGKFLIIRFDRADLVIHLGMSGRLAVAPAEAPRAPHTHLVLGLDDRSELRFTDPRRFGSVVVRDAGAGNTYPPVAGLGPDPLQSDVAAVLVAAARRSRIAIRNLLLDQRIVAGIGNIYANEALAAAGIRPDRPAAVVARGRIERLAGSIRTVLERAVAAGGTTLEDGAFADPSGKWGDFAVELAVYGRDGEECRRCGTVIRRITLNARSAFYCPRCQR